MTSKSYFSISFEKRKFTKSSGIPNEIKHFFKTKSLGKITPKTVIKSSLSLGIAKLEYGMD